VGGTDEGDLHLTLFARNTGRPETHLAVKGHRKEIGELSRKENLGKTHLARERQRQVRQCRSQSPATVVLVDEDRVLHRRIGDRAENDVPYHPAPIESDEHPRLVLELVKPIDNSWRIRGRKTLRHTFGLEALAHFNQSVEIVEGIRAGRELSSIPRSDLN